MTTSIVNQLERLILKDIDLNNYRFHLVLSFLRKFACYDRCNSLKSLQFNLSLIHISEPTRPQVIAYAVFCL